jgi:hypothetical protein
MVTVACVAPDTGSPLPTGDDGFTAFNSGDYKAAIDKFRPLAERCQPAACGMTAWSYKNLGDHVRAYAWYGVAGEHFLAAHQLEGLQLSPEEREAADKLMHELERRYCID